ncbi:hypothetical protein ABPG73_008474 [Tetrahymena malaccensis]
MQEQKKAFDNLEQFKKSNLRDTTHLTLNLGEQQLGDEGVKDMSVNLSKCTELSHLVIYIYENQIGNEGAKSFGQALGNCKKLIDCKLWIYQNLIEDAGASYIAAGLCNFNLITSLGLSLLTNQFGDKGLSAIIIGLNSCDKINDLGLSLSKNKITDEGYEKLDQCLSGLTNLKSLLCVFSDNEKLLKSREILNYYEEAIKYLFESLQMRKNQKNFQHTLISLNCIGQFYFELQNYHESLQYQIESFIIAKQNLTKNNPHLSKILYDMALCYQNLGKSFKSQICFLQSYEVKHYVNQQKISEQDLKDNPYLPFFLRFNQQIGDEGVKSIGMSLSQCTELTYLCIFICGNQISNEGAQNLSLGLGYCKKLEELQLYIQYNQIGNLGASSISTSLKNFTQIRNLILCLQENSIGDNGICEIGLALSKYKNLTKLKLLAHTNQFGDIGVNAILQSLNDCNKISHLSLSLSQNKITDEGYQKIYQCLSNLTNLISLAYVFSDNERLLKSTDILNCQNIKVLTLNFCLFNTMMEIRDQECDKTIIQLLEQQNITYSCEQNKIVVENEDEISFDLNLQDKVISSSIFIQNVKVVAINSINLQNIQAKSINQLISISRIQDLIIKNINMSQCFKFQNLLYASEVDQINVGLIFTKELFIDSAIYFYSSILQIDQISLVNSQVCQFYFFGIDKLIINSIDKLYDESFIILNQCYLKSSYLSDKEIYIKNININLSNISTFIAQTISSIDSILVFHDNSYYNQTINIDTISYKSLFVASSYFQIIEFYNNAVIQINKFIYQKNDSSSSLQINSKNIKTLYIKEIIVEEFLNTHQSFSQESLVQSVNTLNLNIGSMTILRGDNITGSFIQCFNVKSLHIQSIKLQQLEIYSSFIDLYMIDFASIQDIDIINTKFFGYFINANQILYFNLNQVNIQQTLISYILFNIKNLDECQFKHIQLQDLTTNQKQSIIFFIELEIIQIQNQFLFSTIDADLQSKNNLQLLVLNGSTYRFDMLFSTIINGSSNDFGGCLNFINTINTSQNQNINIENSTFQNCRSKYLGGAISGVSKLDSQNKFIKCSSQIGGAIYVSQQLENQQQYNSFQENRSYLAANDFNHFPLKLKILDIQEINLMSSNDTNLFIETDKYLYPGLTYIIRLSIEVDGEWYNQYTNKNDFGNLYNFLVSPSSNFIAQTPTQLQSINFPFIIWSAKDISFSGKQEIGFEDFQIYFANSYNLKTSQYKIYNGCKEQGMEKVYLDKQSSMQFVCQYCEQMKASYYGVCQNCQVEYFLQCYGNYSELKQSYWRSKYSVDSQDILYCSNNPQSCQGGSGIGNELCYEGHIGAQCLNCDIYGTYWNERFSNVGFYQCVKSIK